MRRKSSLSIALLLFSAVLLPFASIPAVASAEIDVTLSSQHEYLVPGTAANVSVTVTNDNLMNTRTFNLTLDTTSLPSDWNVTLSDSALGPVFPTQSDSTTLIVRLDPSANLGSNGQVDLIVTRSDDANESTTVTLQLSVAPLYLPSLDIGAVGDRGLVTIEPNQTVDLDVPVMNSGNVDDTFILQVDETTDLTDFWTNWNNNQSNNSGNSSGNNSGNNSSGNGSNGTSMPGPGKDVPQGWEVRWLDPVAVNMTAGESRNHTLRITVPPNAIPEYRGIALFAGSLGGNFSIQTVIVIEVSVISDVVVQLIHDANRTYLPGVTEQVSFNVTNNGNDETALIYQTTTDTYCSATIAGQSVGGDLQPLESETISLNITPSSYSHWNDSCTISIFAEESSTGVVHESAYTIVLGVDWGWEITPPSNTTFDAGETATIQVGVRNIGSEQDEVRFEMVGPGSISATGPPTWVTVGRGLSDVVSFQVQVPSDTNLIGSHNLTLTATGLHGGEQEVVTIPITIGARSELDLIAPQGGNVLVAAGDSSNFSVMATNGGTSALSFVLDWSGLPSSLSFDPTPPTTTVEVGQSHSIPITVVAGSSSSATSHQVTLYAKLVNSSEIIAQTSFTIEVGHSPSVRILASGDILPVGENTISSMDFVILNDGNEEDQFALALSPSTDGFEVTISPLLITLAASEQQIVTVSMRRTTATGEVNFSLVATSSNDAAVTDSYSFRASEVNLGVIAALTSTDSTASVGQTIQAYLWLTNTGNANQTFQLAITGLNCSNAQSTLTLPPSTSAVPVLLECAVSQNTPAGTTALSASVTSLADPSVSATASLNFTIPQDRVNGQPRLSITVTGSGENTLPHEGSLVLTVVLQNDGNEHLTGTLALVGEGAADLSPSWAAVGGSSNPNYVLSPGQSATYELMLVSTITTNGGELNMRIQAAGSGHLLLSDPFTVNTVGPTVAPDGVSFGFFELDNQISITIMATGWLITILFVLLTISRRRSRSEHIHSTFYDIGDDEDEDSPPLTDLPLPPPPLPDAPALADGEARISDGRVTCMGCSSSLKMPENRDPPFKFKCPKCSESVRVVE